MESESKVLMLKTSQRIPSVHFGLPCLLSEIFREKTSNRKLNLKIISPPRGEPLLLRKINDKHPASIKFLFTCLNVFLKKKQEVVEASRSPREREGCQVVPYCVMLTCALMVKHF